MTRDWLDIGENRAEWRRLLDGVELADFFQLWPVYVPDRAIDVAFHQAFVDHHPGWLDTAATAWTDGAPMDWRQGASQSGGWLIRGGAASPAQADRVAAWLNQRRDVIRQVMSGPLVVALHPQDWLRARDEATDLWSVRIDVIRFTASSLPDLPGFALERPACWTELPRLLDASPRSAAALEERRAGFAGPLLVGQSGLEVIVQHAIRAGLIGAERRQLLMAGLPTGFVYSLPIVKRPIDQLRFDLMELQRTPKLIGLDEPPLAVWLANAARLAGSRKEATGFWQWRWDLLQAGAISTAPAAIARGVPRAVAGAVTALSSEPERAADRLRVLLLESEGAGRRACISLDLAVAVAASKRPPKQIRAATQKARTHVEHLGDLRLIGRAHARTAWIQAILGDRRSSRAEVSEGRRIASLLDLPSDDDLVAELDAMSRALMAASE